MPDEVTNTETITPAAAPVAAPAAPVAAVPAPAPAVAAPAPAPQPAAPERPAKTLAELLGEKGPDEASKRMARAARKALKQFGIDLPKDADVEKAASEYKAKREIRKAEVSTLRAEAEKAKALAATVAEFAAAELKAMPEDKRAIVLAVAGSDPQQQLTKIALLKQAGWITPQAPAAPAAAPATAAPAAPVAATAAAPAPLPAPASSAPAQPGPVPLSPTPVDHMAAFKAIPARSPERAMFLLEHPEVARAILEQTT